MAVWRLYSREGNYSEKGCETGCRGEEIRGEFIVLLTPSILGCCLSSVLSLMLERATVSMHQFVHMSPVML